MTVKDFSMDFFSLKGQVALVTGGNSGIGAACTSALLKAGADVCVVARSEGDRAILEAVASEGGSRLHWIQADLSAEGIHQQVINSCVAVFGKLDILVNNAGMIKRAPIEQYKDEDWKSVIDLNLNAVYYLSQAATKQMLAQGNGKIINIASMLSFQGGKFVPPYTASKHGVAGLTKAFANELAERNIQVNAIAPGYIKTNNTTAIREDEKRSAEILSRIPAGRWGETTDLMGAVVFLASHAADYVTGHTLAVDGGWLVR